MLVAGPLRPAPRRHRPWAMGVTPRHEPRVQFLLQLLDFAGEALLHGAARAPALALLSAALLLEGLLLLDLLLDEPLVPTLLEEDVPRVHAAWALAGIDELRLSRLNLDLAQRRHARLVVVLRRKVRLDFFRLAGRLEQVVVRERTLLRAPARHVAVHAPGRVFEGLLPHLLALGDALSALLLRLLLHNLPRGRLLGALVGVAPAVVLLPHRVVRVPQDLLDPLGRVPFTLVLIAPLLPLQEAIKGCGVALADTAAPPLLLLRLHPLLDLPDEVVQHVLHQSALVGVLHRRLRPRPEPSAALGPRVAPAARPRRAEVRSSASDREPLSHLGAVKGVHRRIP
mmetsp:Transcript_18832/g.57228  ORF Transcript_18832/g.57228 Transcript_18832/m.57228 type:complete len:341 (-) Transcript_18832:1114-2136(-)